MKKLFAILALLALTSMAFAGCMGQTEEPAMEEGEAVVEELVVEPTEEVAEEEVMEEEVVEEEGMLEEAAE
ncbi:hypothetical protein KJ632_03785 [Patescibacteria group bacterium]|nr:hypothetical protein [Patescibacteria group bacterium]